MAAQGSSKKNRARDWRPALRAVLIALCLTAIVSGAIYGSQQIENYFIRDPRFFLPGPPDYGMESPNLKLAGLRFASRAQVLNVFSHDFGRSIYLLPLAERRRALLKINWVKEASIQRQWPNHIAVSVTERQPAAFINISAETMSRWALIDSDGVILEPPRRAQFNLPVLTGIRAGEPFAQRGARVRRMQRMMTDLGPLGDSVSEIDAGDLDDMKIVKQVDGRGLLLMLGDSNFAARLRHFMEHYPDIHRKMPGATNFDLRLDDRITVAEGEHGN